MSDTDHRNEILIVGRVTTPATEFELPSGDVVQTLRVTIDRSTDERFDVVKCTAWSSRMQRAVSSWAKGDVVEVAGALRTRYWRTPAGALGSTHEVEVLRAKRLVAAIKRPRKPE